MGPLGRGLQCLGLSEEQQAKVEQLRQEAQPALGSLREKLDALRRERREAGSPKTFDEAAIRAHVAKVAAIKADLAVRAAKLRADVYSVLTPEQQQKLEEMRAAREACRTCRAGAGGRLRRADSRRFGPRW